MTKGIRKIAKEILGKSRGFISKNKIKVKRVCNKSWSLCNNPKSWGKYKVAKKKRNKALSKDKIKHMMSTKGGERSVYRIVKGREKRQEAWTK
ncbi:hypothetical protein Lal_00042726 [Lupinus albus]|nr:hypothetical protein Lal_00042726 [Lupinus albus]